MKNPAMREIYSPLATRLSRLTQLEKVDLDAVAASQHFRRHSPARREMLAEGAPLIETRAIISGWACRQRILSDGRRQILNYLLPGDLLGVNHQVNATSLTSILAVTDVVTCAAPDARAGSGALAEAYALAAELDEHYLLAQITRLGRFSASERLIDWMLEIQERLTRAGLANDQRLSVPLTQEFLADTLGLTSVHVNRTLQALRRQNLLTIADGTIVLHDQKRLERMVHFKPARPVRTVNVAHRAY